MGFIAAVLLALLQGAAAQTQSGTFEVRHAVFKFTGKENEKRPDLQIWYPDGPAPRGYPLLLFLPGLGYRSQDYSFQLKVAAGHGYFIVGVDPAENSQPPSETTAVVWANDMLVAKRAILSSSYQKLIDRDRVGAFGHSHGGRSAAAACILDPAIRACLNQDGRLDDVHLQRPYWPIQGRAFAGSFAMLDWFDPGFDDDDFRSMHTTREQYAAERLAPEGAALAAYRAAVDGSYRITLLTRGMRHTDFADVQSDSASAADRQAAHEAHLRQISEATLAFFDYTLKRTGAPACGRVESEALVQCFGPASPK